MSAAMRARMRLKEADDMSHFEQSLNSLKTAKRGSAGRSAVVQEFLEEGCSLTRRCCRQSALIIVS